MVVVCCVLWFVVVTSFTLPSIEAKIGPAKMAVFSALITKNAVGNNLCIAPSGYPKELYQGATMLKYRSKHAVFRSLYYLPANISVQTHQSLPPKHNKMKSAN